MTFNSIRYINVPLYMMIVCIYILLGSCHKDDSPAPKQAHLKIKFESVSEKYDALDLHIQHIWTRTSSGGGKIHANKKLNVLSVKSDSVIASGHVPHGTVQEVILELSESGHQIVMDGFSHILEMPKGKYIAIDIPADMQLMPNKTHALLLNIDLSQFIYATENGNFHINPTISAVLD